MPTESASSATLCITVLRFEARRPTVRVHSLIVENICRRHSRRMIEAHQPMRGNSAAHRGDRAPSSIQKSYESLQLQQRGNYDDFLPGRHVPAQRVNHDPIDIFVIGWWSLCKQEAPNYFDRPGVSRILPYTANICNASEIRPAIICMMGRSKLQFEAYIEFACRASRLKMRLRNT